MPGRTTRWASCDVGKGGVRSPACASVVSMRPSGTRMMRCLRFRGPSGPRLCAYGPPGRSETRAGMDDAMGVMRRCRGGRSIARLRIGRVHASLRDADDAVFAIPGAERPPAMRIRPSGPERDACRDGRRDGRHATLQWGLVGLPACASVVSMRPCGTPMMRCLRFRGPSGPRLCAYGPPGRNHLRRGTLPASPFPVFQYPRNNLIFRPGSNEIPAACAR